MTKTLKTSGTGQSKQLPNTIETSTNLSGKMVQIPKWLVERLIGHLRTHSPTTFDGRATIGMLNRAIEASLSKTERAEFRERMRGRKIVAHRYSEMLPMASPASPATKEPEQSSTVTSPLLPTPSQKVSP